MPVRVIRGADFPAATLHSLEGVPLRHENAAKIEKRALQPNDLVIEISGGTKERPTGRTIRITPRMLQQSSVPVIPASFCRLVRIDPMLADPVFVYYALQHLYLQGGTWEFQNQSTGLSNFQFELFKNRYSLPEVDRGEQGPIGEVLSALDEKIARNARVIAAADALANASFRAAATTSVPLSSLARFVNGKAFTKDATGTGRVVVRIADLNSGLGGSTVYNDIDVADEHLARPGDLLFAWSGSLTAARWFRPEAIVNQHIFKVIPNAGVPMWLVNQAVHAKLGEFKAIAADKATTMGHIQRQHLDQPVLIPSAEAAKTLDPLMGGLWDRALAAEVESLKLTATRDELLPLLMSGNVRVRDAEKVVEGVA
jgi:type I restriction enzyme S subunit